MGAQTRCGRRFARATIAENFNTAVDDVTGEIGYLDPAALEQEQAICDESADTPFQRDLVDAIWEVLGYR
jgi:hypothetical protein